MKLLALSFFGLLATASAGGKGPSCKCYPGDKCWPAKREWDALSRETQGRLSVELPPGLPCFETYEGQPVEGANDPAKCAEVTENWTDASWV